MVPAPSGFTNAHYTLVSVAYQRMNDMLYVKARSAMYYAGSGSVTGKNLSDAAAAFDSQGELDPTLVNDGMSSLQPWKWVAGFVRAGAQSSTVDSTGVYSSAWVAGTGSEDSRTFNVLIANDSSLGLVGTGFFGFGYPVASSSYDGFVDHFYCNWTARATQDSVYNTDFQIGSTQTRDKSRGLIDRAQMQKFYFAGVNGWQVQSVGGVAQNFINYAPTSSCDATGFMRNGLSGTYKFRYTKFGSDGTTQWFDSVQTNNLQSKGDSDSTFKDYVKRILKISSLAI